MAPLTKLITQLGFLGLRANPAHDGQDERVLQLFRNRAELKKSHVALQDQLHRLRERVRQQEDAITRLQEMLQGLEARLGRPDTAYPALVFYQLRELWRLGHSLLKEFVAGLSAQQDASERRAFFAEHNQRQFERRQAGAAMVQAAEQRLAQVRDQLSGLERQLAELKWLWHYFKRRGLRQSRQAANLQSLLCLQELQAARAALTAVEAEPAPAFPGLSLGARRRINVAALVLAQLLSASLSHTPLVELAREAAGRREPPRDQYGDRARCEELVAQIQQASRRLQQRGGRSMQVRAGSAKLQSLARYRSEVDTVPTVESLMSVPEGSRILSEDIWELYATLLR